MTGRISGIKGAGCGPVFDDKPGQCGLLLRSEKQGLPLQRKLDQVLVQNTSCCCGNLQPVPDQLDQALVLCSCGH